VFPILVQWASFIVFERLSWINSVHGLLLFPKGKGNLLRRWGGLAGLDRRLAFVPCFLIGFFWCWWIFLCFWCFPRAFLCGGILWLFGVTSFLRVFQGIGLSFPFIPNPPIASITLVLSSSFSFMFLCMGKSFWLVLPHLNHLCILFLWLPLLPFRFVSLCSNCPFFSLCSSWWDRYLLPYKYLPPYATPVFPPSMSPVHHSKFTQMVFSCERLPSQYIFCFWLPVSPRRPRIYSTIFFSDIVTVSCPLIKIAFCSHMVMSAEYCPFLETGGVIFCFFTPSSPFAFPSCDGCLDFSDSWRPQWRAFFSRSS